MPRLLVVDDEEIIHRLLREGLQRHGITDVLFARDGLEALEAMEGADPAVDAVILDHRMPKMDGLTVAGHMRERWPEAQVIFFTADLEAAEKARELGLFEVLVKPVSLQIIFNTISSALGEE
ncbi:MAG: response regulator [Thermoplasmata archaeon]|nr:MAG: response regulator [Thermoplasmata archaeon]